MFAPLWKATSRFLRLGKGKALPYRRKGGPVRPRFRPNLLEAILEDRTAPAMTFTWSGAGNGTWSDPNDWLINGAKTILTPGATDTVVFNNQSVVPNGKFTATVNPAFQGTTATIGSLQSNWSGIIELGANLTVSNGLTFQQGTFDGIGNLSLNGNSTWTTGNIVGDGTTKVFGQLTVQPPNQGGVSFFVGQLLIEKNAILTLSGGTIQTGNGSVITNQGIFKETGQGSQIVNETGTLGHFDNVNTGTVFFSTFTGIAIPFNQLSSGAVSVTGTGLSLIAGTRPF